MRYRFHPVITVGIMRDVSRAYGQKRGVAKVPSRWIAGWPDSKHFPLMFEEGLVSQHGVRTCVLVAMKTAPDVDLAAWMDLPLQTWMDLPACVVACCDEDEEEETQ